MMPTMTKMTMLVVTVFLIAAKVVLVLKLSNGLGRHVSLKSSFVPTGCRGTRKLMYQRRHTTLRPCRCKQFHPFLCLLHGFCHGKNETTVLKRWILIPARSWNLSTLGITWLSWLLNFFSFLSIYHSLPVTCSRTKTCQGIFWCSVAKHVKELKAFVTAVSWHDHDTQADGLALGFGRPALTGLGGLLKSI